MSTPTADITLSGPVNGMCEPDTSGPYVVLNVTPKDQDRARYKLSFGAAEVLSAELMGLLHDSQPTPTDSRDERLRELATLRETITAAIKLGNLETPYVSIAPDLMLHILDRLAAASPLAALVEELVGALKVFTKHHANWMNEKLYPDNEETSTYARHTFGQLRQARALIDRAAAVTAGSDAS